MKVLGLGTWKMKLIDGKYLGNLRLISIIFISLFYKGAFSQEMPLAGLYFSSHETTKDQRTSLHITLDKSLNVFKGLRLEFDANFRRGDGHYGYVFRMIDDQKNNLDFVSNLASETLNFALVWKDRTLATYRWEDVPNGGFDEWIKVSLDIDPQNEQISLSLNTHKKTASFKELIDLSNFNIVFGACNQQGFLNSDVSPMTLKDIRLFDSKSKLLRHWKLSKHGTAHVFDEIANAPAEIKNPIWLINNHTKWKHLKDLQFNNLAGVCQNDSTGEIYIVDSNALYILTIGSEALDTIRYMQGAPFKCKGNQVIFNSYTKEIWSYDLERNSMSKFDFNTRHWSVSEVNCNEPDLWHHTKLISPVDTSLLTFGGYGHYLYKNSFNRYKKETGWEKIELKGSSIYPRYLSGLGIMYDESILIFGGYGSKTGQQELSPEFYYDLYKIDLRDFAVEKLWEFEEGETSYVPGCNLLYNPTSNSFYTLLYNSSHFETSLRLAMFGLDAPDMKIMADPVPYKFLDTESWCNLFLDIKRSELLAVAVYSNQLNLYSLSYPPLSQEDVYQQTSSIFYAARTWIVLLSPVLFLLLLYLVYKNKNRIFVHNTPNPAHLESKLNQARVRKQKSSAVYLFGGFQVFDKDGKDITMEFTPTLKELFLIIFLHTYKNEKGVTSQVLNEALWLDKSEDSARNNRNVNISKLRPLIEKIGHLEFTKEGNFWKITPTGEFYCDYVECLFLLGNIVNASEPNEDEMQKLFNVALSGEFLPDIQNEWMDVFKSEFSNFLIDSLISLSERLGEKRSKEQLLYNLADCILKHDMLNEDAIAIKCTALYNLGKKGLAKHSYESFCRGFKNVIGDDFKISFDKLVKQKIV